MEKAIKIYEQLSKPPKTALRKIEAGKLKNKTDINPQWRYRAMTELFGLVGFGWKYEIQKLWTEDGSNGEVLAFAQIAVSVKQGECWSEPIVGVGGSKLVQIERERPVSNDEGYKMAITDAFSTALKMLGVAAAIYEGQWDGSKYIDNQPALNNANENQQSTAQQQSLKGGEASKEEREEITSILSSVYENGRPVFSAKEKQYYMNMRKERSAAEVIAMANEDMLRRYERYNTGGS